MIKFLFFSFINKIIKSAKKRGFTLSEALVVTVMAGYCLLPILGTMQNASTRTEKYDHYTKMLQYNRSRLNAEIANAAFDHTFINTNPTYHYLVYYDASGDASKAVLTELPETSITPEDLASVDSESSGAVVESALKYLGIKGMTTNAYLKIVHAYETRVDTNYNFALEDNVADSDAESFPAPKGLLSICVTTRLYESEGDRYNSNGFLITDTVDYDETKFDENVFVKPVSDFSMVNLPVVSDGFIWLADAYNMKLYGIDPESHIIGTTIVLPSANTSKPQHKNNNNYRPWKIAVHPSLKFLAVTTTDRLYLVNVDGKSSNRGQIKSITFNSITLGDSHFLKNPGGKASDGLINASGAWHDCGIAFRPDGKYLFAASPIEKKLYVFDVLYSLDSGKNILNWSSESLQSPRFKRYEVSIGSGKRELEPIDLPDDSNISAIIAANDGNLYLSFVNDKSVIRLPMYPVGGFDANWKWEYIYKSAESSKRVPYDLAASPDGSLLAVAIKTADNKNKVDIYNTKTRTCIKEIDTSSSSTTNFGVIFNAYSGATSNLIDKNALTVITTNTTSGNKYIANTFNIIDGNPNRKTSVKGDEANYTASRIVADPNGPEAVIADSKKPYVYFGKIDNSTSDEEIASDSEYLLKHGTDDNTISDLKSFERDILAVGYDSSSKSKIQLYDINTFSKLEDNTFSAPNAFSSLAMNPNGDLLVGSFGDGNKGYSRFHIKDLSYRNVIDLSGHSKKSILDGSYPNMLFSLEYNLSTEKDSSGKQLTNALWNADNESQYWEYDASNSYDRRDFDLDVSWERRDIAGLPNGGVLALYGKSDGSSMLEWIGKNNNSFYPSTYGKYKLFARWVTLSNTGSFFRLPEYKCDSFISDKVDSNAGFIAIEIAKPFEKGSVITKIKIRAGKWDDGSTRWVTPMIFKREGDKNYKIIDYVTTSLSMSSTGKNEFTPNWKNGGKIDEDNLYVGFWNGNINPPTRGGDGKSAGAVAFEYNDIDFTFYSDCGREASCSDAVRASDINVGNIMYLNDHAVRGDDHSTITANWRRKYAIEFISGTEGKEEIVIPEYSKKIAVSPDGNTLAILSGVTGGSGKQTPRIHLYDFCNGLYGPDTQLEGMLIDYRREKQSGAYGGGGKVLGWPAETDESLFKDVYPSNLSLGIESNKVYLSSVCSKNETWSSFKDYPGNYFFHDNQESKLTGINIYKGGANKRIFGYLRPEYSVKYLQMYASEDTRYFYNHNFIAGRTEVGAITYPDKYELNINEYNTGIFQADTASNGEGMYQGIFLGVATASNNDIFRNSNTNANIEEKVVTTTDFTKNYIHINNINKGWDYLRSNQTYILKNVPSHMASYDLVTTESSSVKAGVDNASMIFSRDRSRMTIYIMDPDNKCFWTLAQYNEGRRLLRVRCNVPADTKVSNNLAISSDGHKLLMGVGNRIKAYNITEPVISENRYNYTNLYRDLSTTASEYLGYLGEMSCDGNVSFLATKPYTSFNAINVGGNYRECNSSDFSSVKIATNNALAVASGGIYIYDAGNKKIYCYNPVLGKPVCLTTLDKASPYCPMTAYDNSIYIWGNDGTVSSVVGVPDDPICGRVQRLGLNDKKVICSLDESWGYTNEYQVNMSASNHAANNFSNPDDFFSCSDNTALDRDSNYGDFTDVEYPHVYDAFFLGPENKNHWRSQAITSSELYIIYNNKSPVWVNKIVLSNYINVNYTSKNYWMKDYKLYGSNDGSDGEEIASGTLSKPELPTDRYQAIINVEKTYSKYKLKGLKNSNGGKPVSVALIQFYRTGVKRLTPGIKAFAGQSENSGNTSLEWTKGDNTKTKMKWTHTSNSYTLKDIYISNSENNNIVSGSAGWENNKARPSLLIELEKPEAVCAVRYANGNPGSDKKIVKSFRLYGANGDSAPTYNENDDSLGSGWEPISFASGNTVFNNAPRAHSTFITADVRPSKKYKYYLFRITERYDESTTNTIRLTGFELFSMPMVDTDSMTKLLTDSLGEVKVGAEAACSTPYGTVISGGHVNNTGENFATSTCLLYWPHAINQYDGKYYQFGISKSLPNLKQKRFNHAMVWHKGRLFAIGGSINQEHALTGEGKFSEYLAGIKENASDSKTLQWVSINSTNYHIAGGSSSVSVEGFLKRFYPACCSYGDEIFIFGGADASKTKLVTAYAWNPDTGLVRRLSDIPVALSPCSAVVYGSIIYIYGIDNANTPRLYVYEP